MSLNAPVSSWMTVDVTDLVSKVSNLRALASSSVMVTVSWVFLEAPVTFLNPVRE